MIKLYELVKSDAQYFKQLSCKELLFTQYDCPQNKKTQDLSSHLNFIVYVLSGKRIFHQPGKSYMATEGKCFFSKKGGWLAEMEPHAGWCVLVFFIPDNYLKQFIKEYRPNLPIKGLDDGPTDQMIELDVNDVTRNFFISMVPYFTQNPSPPENLLELKFRELIFNILINPANKELLRYLRGIADNDGPSLQDVMEANYIYNLSLDEFAKITHRSLASFKREFQLVFKISPGRWLIKKRLDYASLLLYTSSKPVNEISFESGFENTTHFSRVFKERFGVSPLVFRKQSSTAAP